MFETLLYLDSVRRIRIYKQGGHQLEYYVDGMGWCLCDDDAEWPDASQAFMDLQRILISKINNP